MKNDLLWVCYLMVSNHMWDDENTPARFYNMPPRYQAENVNDLSFWDEIIAFLKERQFNAVRLDLGDGVCWEKHPEIAAPNAWTKNQLSDILAKLRAAGIKPLPELNFSTCHDTWTKDYRHRLCTPEYYTFVADMIDEVSEIFGKPEQFHLGMDEENFENQRFREMVRIRNEKLYWHDLYFMFDRCEKNGCRPIVYGDYYWNNPEQFKKHMPKSVLIQNWFYNHFQDYPVGGYYRRSMDAYRALDELGYDQLPLCSTWMNKDNPEETIVNVPKMVREEHLVGFQTSLWAKMDWDNEFWLKNDIHRLYLARKKHMPETLA